MPTKRNKKRQVTVNPVVKELDAIKKLFVLHLLKGGATQTEIAVALGVTQGYVSRMIPTKVKDYE